MLFLGKEIGKEPLGESVYIQYGPGDQLTPTGRREIGKKPKPPPLKRKRSRGRLKLNQTDREREAALPPIAQEMIPKKNIPGVT